MKKEKKILISNILISILIIFAIIISILIIIEYANRYKNEKNIEKIILDTYESVQEKDSKQIPYIEYEGYQVIGIVKIPKINIEYPILIDSTEQSLKKSISRFGNNEVNGLGNLCLAGHNYIDGTMFGNINQLENGDEINVFDLYGEEVAYNVFDKYITNPNDNNVLKATDDKKREITLITCINGNKDRLIIKASES